MKAARAQTAGKALAARRGAMLEAWLTRTLQTYPEHTARLLMRERDPFRNPVGHAFQEALPVLLDELLGGMEPGRLGPALDRVVQIRAVQEFTPARAVAFVFLLKDILREELGGRGGPEAEGLAALEDRVDEMALSAFDLFVKWRERTAEIKVEEARRRIYLLARRQQAAASCPVGELAGSSGSPPRPGGTG